MKIHALTRSVDDILTPGSRISKLPQTLDPSLHPFQRAREYTQALTASKLDRMFAKPFIGQLGYGHIDGVYSLECDPFSLERLASGSGDGVVKAWDLLSHKEIWSIQAHSTTSIVKGVTWTRDKKLITCSSDCTARLFNPYELTTSAISRDQGNLSSHEVKRPVAIFNAPGALTSVSHHRSLPQFAASSTVVAIFDTNRPGSTPIQTLSWPNNVNTIKFCIYNYEQSHIIVSAGSDKSIILHDTRANSSLQRATLTFPTNSISWCPTESHKFVTASEDHNLYIFDMRSMRKALNILKGHVAAAMSVNWSPNGRDIVSGSYDRTLRIWDALHGSSRDIYHTRRMQRVFSVAFSPDEKYIFSGSDEGNIRVWRSQASSRVGVLTTRERQKLERDNGLLQQYGHMPQIKRILRHRHIPKVVRKDGLTKREEIAAAKRREQNELRFTKPGKSKSRKSERAQVVTSLQTS